MNLHCTVINKITTTNIVSDSLVFQIQSLSLSWQFDVVVRKEHLYMYDPMSKFKQLQVGQFMQIVNL